VGSTWSGLSNEALQKKLLVLVYTLWRKDEKYDEKKMNIQSQEAEASLLGCCAAA
jgi:hypothetical protein